MQEYVSPSTIKKSYEVSFTSLANWAKDGKIRCVATPGGCRKYHYNDVVKLLGHPEAEIQEAGKTVLYARVSSQKQAKDGDLDRQIENLKRLYENQYPDTNYVVKKDVASGINWKRKGLRYLLDEAHSGNLGTIVVSDRDRLCRFAFDLVAYIFKQRGVKILVLNKNDDFESADATEQSQRADLSEDLLAIVNVFVAQANGYRSERNKKVRANTHHKENQDLPDAGSDTEVEDDDGDSEVDL